MKNDRQLSKELDVTMELAEEAERQRILKDNLNDWHKGALVDLLLCIKTNHPKEYIDYRMEYDEILRGN